MPSFDVKLAGEIGSVVDTYKHDMAIHTANAASSKMSFLTVLSSKQAEVFNFDVDVGISGKNLVAVLDTERSKVSVSFIERAWYGVFQLQKISLTCGTPVCTHTEATTSLA